MKLSADPLDFSPPRDARWRGPLLLALFVHGLLVIALTWGVSWQQDAPAAAVSAELWAALPAAAAPRAVEVEPITPLPPKPRPEPVPLPSPPMVKPLVAKAVDKPAPNVDAGPSEAQIALQRKKAEEERHQQELERQRELELKRQQELKKKDELRKKEEARKEAEREKAEKAKQDKLKQEKLAAEQREAEAKEARKREQAKQDEARKKREAEDRKKREEQAAQEKAEQAARDKAAKEKAAKEKAAKEKAAKDKATAAQIEADRKKQLARMMGQAGDGGDASGKGSGTGGSSGGSAGGSGHGSGGAGGSGSGAGGGGASAGYAAKVAARIKTFYNAPEQFPANLTAEAEIRTLPDGTILSQRLLKSSGNPAFDETVLRAIDRAGRLPKDENGRMPDTTFVIKFRP